MWCHTLQNWEHFWRSLSLLFLVRKWTGLILTEQPSLTWRLKSLLKHRIMSGHYQSMEVITGSARRRFLAHAKSFKWLRIGFACKKGSIVSLSKSVVAMSSTCLFYFSADDWLLHAQGFSCCADFFSTIEYMSAKRLIINIFLTSVCIDSIENPHQKLTLIRGFWWG